MYIIKMCLSSERNRSLCVQ